MRPPLLRGQALVRGDPRPQVADGHAVHARRPRFVFTRLSAWLRFAELALFSISLRVKARSRCHAVAAPGELGRYPTVRHCTFPRPPHGSSPWAEGPRIYPRDDQKEYRVSPPQCRVAAPHWPPAFAGAGLYPISVRRLPVLPPASSPPRITATQLPLAIGSAPCGTKRTSKFSAMRGTHGPRLPPGKQGTASRSNSFTGCHENKRSCSGSGPCAYSLRSIFIDRGARRAALVVSEEA